MASTKPKKVTAANVEDMKTRQGFDRDLARAIMPLHHPRRRIVDHPVMSQQFVDAIRDHIDGHFGRFVAAGARQVPRQVYSRKPLRRRHRFAPREDLNKLLLRFLDVCFAELHERKLSRSELRSVTKRARVLIVAIVERTSQLAEFVAC